MPTNKVDNEYYSFEEMSLEAEKDFIDPLLYKFILWLTCKEVFMAGSDISGFDLVPSCLHIATTSINYPKHLGLAVFLNNEFGSQKLIDTMFNMGYSISYTELRQFITSVVIYVNSLQVPPLLGSYLPPEILRCSG